MKIRLNKAHFPVTTLGCGRRLGVWVQGCTIGCKGCVSQDTWAAGGGWEVDVQDVVAWCDERTEGGIDGITISGGEPFEQPEALKALLQALDEWRAELEEPFDILCYSGMPLRKLERRHADILAGLDALIPEPYVERSGAGSPAADRWRGSSNQPLVPLTALGRMRYGEEPQTGKETQRMQVSVANGSVWFIGIPQPGDMERMAERARARGVELKGVSWRA